MCCNVILFVMGQKTVATCVVLCCNVIRLDRCLFVMGQKTVATCVVMLSDWIGTCLLWGKDCSYLCCVVMLSDWIGA